MVGKMYSSGPNGADMAENDKLINNGMYSMPDGETCSAEFPQGCIKSDEHAD